MSASEFLVWGNNQSNLLSTSGSKCLASPTPLCLGYEITSLCASQKHISFLTSDGSVFSYGTNLDGRLGVSTKSVDKVGYDAPVKVPIRNRVIRIESGFSHMCALTEMGELFAWGLGDYGALGTGEFKSRSTPTRIQLPKNALESLRQISCGAMHTAFLTESGEVFTCGSNEYGELGVNKPEKVSTPLPISFHQEVQQISCGVFYTLLLTKDGRVFGMGNNKYGQLGIGHKVNECHPTLVRDLEGIVKVSAGYHSGAIDCYGNLFIWGSGSFGEFIRPQKFVLSVPIRDIAIRGFFGLAIGHTTKNENRVYTWGNNTFGELGVGDFNAARQPMEVEVLRGREIGKIVLGVNFAMVLLYENSLAHNPWTSQEFAKLAEDNKNFERYPRETERKSVVGFEEGYLNSHLKNYEKSERLNNLNRDYERELSNTNKNNNNNRGQRKDLSYEKEVDRRRERSVSPVATSRVRDQTAYSKPAKDYQKLFITLSEDYEKLCAKYSALEKQFNILSSQPQAQVQVQVRDFHGREQTFRGMQNNNDGGQIALKDQISKNQFEIISLKDELRVKNRLIEDQRFEIDRLSKNSVTSERGAISNELEAEYNKFLNQKQQLINKLNKALKEQEDQNTVMRAKMQREKEEYIERIEVEKDKTTKIVNQHQQLIDELQSELKKSEVVIQSFREENDHMKQKFSKMQDSWREIETFRAKIEEESQTERSYRERCENQLKQSQMKNEILGGKMQELEIQLNYEKQFNKKYESTINQSNLLKEKLHKELTFQMDVHKESQSKIQNLKADVEKYKKYKKELDEKNIILEEHEQNFENYKRKISDIIGQKEDRIADLEEDAKNQSKQFEARLRQKDQSIESLSKETNRFQKEIAKNKENISALKQQITLKENQLDNLHQQRISMQKKISYLSSELNKQVNEREQLVKDLGEVKREMGKLRISYDEVQNKYEIEREEKQKVMRQLGMKNDENEMLKNQVEKLTEKCQNLRKENNMYKIEIEDANIKIQEQGKVNDELEKANRQFAEAEEEFNQRVKQLESRVFELEDENKSYLPRYDALMIRNNQLDARNRELAEMINKAIEIQAENYKSNILKEVQSNTDNFLNQVKEEQEFRSKGRRNKQEEPEIKRSQRSQEFKSPPVSQIKEEPYTMEMKKRLTSHKRKVSESANKLASLLDIDEGLRTERRELGIDSRRTEDLQKLNTQMQSFNNHKEEFMSKIQSFAEKLKIL